MITPLRYLYSLLLFLLTPFILLRLYWRSRLARDYRKRISERFARYSQKYATGGICLHAVSVGELMAAKPLVAKIKAQYPDLPLTITTTTPTASKQVKMIYNDTVQHVYLPYDYPHTVQRFLNTFNPKIMLIMETEIWPNLFFALKQRSIPILIINGRLSEKSMNQYRKLKFFFAPILEYVSCIAAQSSIDEEHFLQLGAMQNKIMIMGNIKYDVAVPEDLIAKAKQMRASFGTRPVWIASSTHEAEEDLIITTAMELKKQIPNVLCIIVPRHPERFNAVSLKCIAKNLNIVRRSQNESVSDNTDIFIGDTLGELFFFYALSDVALVCGSFAMIGGHNILEPASLGLPTIVGPQMFNFQAILADFLAKDALKQVDSQSLLPTLLGLLVDKPSGKALGDRACNLVRSNQGAVDRVWEKIRVMIESK